jgi:hypothetical protein
MSGVEPGIETRPGSSKLFPTESTGSVDPVFPQESTIAVPPRIAATTRARRKGMLSSLVKGLRPFSGMSNDIRSRAPFYASDWSDAWNYR